MTKPIICAACGRAAHPAPTDRRPWMRITLVGGFTIHLCPACNSIYRRTTARPTARQGGQD
ncbi:MAG: hypothetical protein HZC41_21980 [Chloroflexi bacterium]|nr:hypothetical protein [Chloroflexota bacterium]